MLRQLTRLGIREDANIERIEFYQELLRHTPSILHSSVWGASSCLQPYANIKTVSRQLFNRLLRVKLPLRSLKLYWPNVHGFAEDFRNSVQIESLRELAIECHVADQHHTDALLTMLAVSTVQLDSLTYRLKGRGICNMSIIAQLLGQLNGLNVFRLAAAQIQHCFDTTSIVERHSKSIQEMELVAWEAVSAHKGHNIVSGAELDFWLLVPTTFPKLTRLKLVLPRNTATHDELTYFWHEGAILLRTLHKIPALHVLYCRRYPSDDRNYGNASRRSRIGPSSGIASFNNRLYPLKLVPRTQTIQTRNQVEVYQVAYKDKEAIDESVWYPLPESHLFNFTALDLSTDLPIL